MIEKKLAGNILSAIYDAGELSLSKLVKATNGNWDTVLRRIQDFRAGGLIYVQKSKKFPFTLSIGLTKKGRELASFTTPPKVERLLRIEDGMVLALLHAMEGELRGSTKLEKFIYRTQVETNFEKCFKYIPHKFGPFSADVLNTAQRLAFMEYIEIEEKIWEVDGDLEKTLVIYRLTPRGTKAATDIFNKLPSDVKKKFSEFKLDKNKPLESFLREFYKKYPEFKKQTKLDKSYQF